MTEVYALRVPGTLDRQLFEELLGQIGPDKRERLLTLVKEADQLRGLFGDLLLRSVIMGKTGLANNDISFAVNRYGKPYLKGWQGLHFNLSHSGTWAVAAVDTRPVGVDVQRVETVDLDIAQHYFSDDEYRDLLTQPDKVSYFFDLWTLKESYMKIVGMGLSMPLDSFSIRPGEDNRFCVSTRDEVIEDIHFSQYHIDKDYKLALCATHDQLPEQVILQQSGLFDDWK